MRAARYAKRPGSLHVNQDFEFSEFVGRNADWRHTCVGHDYLLENCLENRGVMVGQLKPGLHAGCRFSNRDTVQRVVACRV